MHPGHPFSRFAKWVSHRAGHPMTFIAAVLIVIVWLTTGPVFAYSTTWQLAINTTTTIVTFLMVFLIQNSQNRDSAAMQIKLDELIRAHDHTHNALLDLEELTDEELEKIRAKYERLAEEARRDLRQGKGDVGTPEV